MELKTQKLFKNKDFLIENYIEKNRTIKDISQQLEISSERLRYWLNKYDIRKDSNILKSQRFNNQKKVFEDRDRLNPCNDRDFLYEQYILFQKSSKDIANQLNISSEIVVKFLKRFNLLRSQSDRNSIGLRKRYLKDRKKHKSKKWLIQNYIENDLSGLQISKLAGTTEQAIYFWLHKFNIPIKSHSEIMSRKISIYGSNYHLKTKSGKLINSSTGQLENYDSSYEFKFMLIMNSKNINYTKNHGIYIPYTMEDKQRHYIPDFLVDEKYLVEIKPKVLINTPINRLKIEAAKKFCKSNNLVFQIWTEEELRI